MPLRRAGQSDIGRTMDLSDLIRPDAIIGSLDGTGGGATGAAAIIGLLDDWYGRYGRC